MSAKAIPAVELLEADGLLEPSFLQRLREEAAAREEESGEDAEDVSARDVPPHLDVLRLCQVGALRGGLFVALDVRADELIGSLCAAMGGTARKVKVLDVRERPHGVLELEVMCGELLERWELEDLYGLVHNLNDLLKDDAGAKTVAILGEWQDMLQLWCLEKPTLKRILRRPYFAPRNHHQLRALSS